MDLNSLNEDQLEAVLHTDGVMSLIAGAGAGKSHTLVTKIEYLIENGVFPNYIWVMTFTNKATSELITRLEKNLGKEVSKRVNVGTLHSIAYRLYKRLVPKYKIKRIMVNDGGAMSHLYAFLRNNKNKAHTGDANGLMSVISQKRLEGMTLNNFKNYFAYTPNNNPDEMWSYAETILKTFEAYEQFKKNKGYMDYNDMLIFAVAELENPSNSAKIEFIQKSCKYLLIDEGQDTNSMCHRIINVMIAENKNAMMVLDKKQAIFGFQGGNVENANAYEKRHNAKVMGLKYNYRSTKEIVENANNFMRGAKFVTDKDIMLPTKGSGESIKILYSRNEAHEGYQVFELVDDLIKKGYQYKDIAILYRLHAQSLQLEDLFLLNEIPYITYTKDTFFDRKEVKDILTYLKIVYDLDNLNIKDIKRISNRPVRYISNKALKDVTDRAFMNNETILDALYETEFCNLNYSEKKSLDVLKNDLSSLVRLQLEGKSPRELCLQILKVIGYERYAKEASKSDNIETDVVINFDSILGFLSQQRDLDEVFNTVNKIIEYQKAKKSDSGNYIKMMTLHASKGREFPVVIMLGNCTHLYPFHRNDDLEEERRLTYVGITRPEKELYLSSLTEKYGRKKVEPSMYTKMMNLSVMEELTDYAGTEEEL